MMDPPPHTPHTAYECSLTSWMGLEWWLETFYVGLEPQPLHNCITVLGTPPPCAELLPRIQTPLIQTI